MNVPNHRNEIFLAWRQRDLNTPSFSVDFTRSCVDTNVLKLPRIRARINRHYKKLMMEPARVYLEIEPRWWKWNPRNWNIWIAPRYSHCRCLRIVRFTVTYARFCTTIAQLAILFSICDRIDKSREHSFPVLCVHTRDKLDGDQRQLW